MTLLYLDLVFRHDHGRNRQLHPTGARLGSARLTVGTEHARTQSAERALVSGGRPSVLRHGRALGSLQRTCWPRQNSAPIRTQIPPRYDPIRSHAINESSPSTLLRYSSSHQGIATTATAPTRPTNHPQHRPDGCTDACRGPKKRPGCWGATQSVAGSRPPGRRHCACSFLGRHRCPSALGPVLRPPRALASRAAGHSSSHMPSLETGWTIVIMCNQSSTIHRLNAGAYDQTKNGGLIAPIQDSHQTSPCL